MFSEYYTARAKFGSIDVPPEPNGGDNPNPNPHPQGGGGGGNPPIIVIGGGGTTTPVIVIPPKSNGSDQTSGNTGTSAGNTQANQTGRDTVLDVIDNILNPKQDQGLPLGLLALIGIGIFFLIKK